MAERTKEELADMRVKLLQARTEADDARGLGGDLGHAYHILRRAVLEALDGLDGVSRLREPEGERIEGYITAEFANRGTRQFTFVTGDGWPTDERALLILKPQEGDDR